MYTCIHEYNTIFNTCVINEINEKYYEIICIHTNNTKRIWVIVYLRLKKKNFVVMNVDCK